MIFPDKGNSITLDKIRYTWSRYTKDVREAVEALKDIKPENLPAFLR